MQMYKQLNDVYYFFHTQDPEWCVKSLLEMNNLSEEVFENNLRLKKAKAKYEAKKETLAELIKFRNEMRKEELMEAVIKSDHSYAEIMAFIKGEKSKE